ncbi:MAG: FAD/NAD(P)-binding protein [Thermodesulfobacteriota bacterium]
MTVNFNNPWLPKPYRIDRIKRETNDVFTLNLSPKDDIPDIPFEPGQFNMLYVYGVGEIPVSLSGNPTELNKLSHTIRSVGTVTKALSKLKRGDIIGIRGPFGSKWPFERAKGCDVVIVAGGIGLAPLKPMMHKIFSERENYGNIVLLYGTRSPEDIIYKRELEKWRVRFGIEVDITVDMSNQDWHGNVGMVTTLIKKAGFNALNVLVFICGPEVMMRYTVSELQILGIDEGNIFISMERNMKCAVGFCGRCQYGHTFICKDGPVFSYSMISNLLKIREL